MALSLLRLSDVHAQIYQRGDSATFSAKLKSKTFADGTGWVVVEKIYTAFFGLSSSPEPGELSIVFLPDEKPGVASVGSASARALESLGLLIKFKNENRVRFYLFLCQF